MSPPAGPASPPATPPYPPAALVGRRLRRWRRVLVVAGALTMGYAVAGGLLDADLRPVGVLVFLAAGLLAHDLLVLPLAIGAGALLGRWLPARAGTAVRLAGYVSATVLVLAVPLVLGFGVRPDDPSALPRDYGWGLAAVLLLVWTAALVSVAGPALRRRRRGGRRHADPVGMDTVP